MRVQNLFFIALLLTIAPLNYARADAPCGLECDTENNGKWLVCPEENKYIDDVYYCDGESWQLEQLNICGEDDSGIAPGTGFINFTSSKTGWVSWVRSDKRKKYYMFDDNTKDNFCYGCRAGYKFDASDSCVPISKNSANLSRACAYDVGENDWCDDFGAGGTDGRCRYLKSGDVTQLTCATINCKEGYYLYLNDKGNSMGICHSESAAQKRCEGKCADCSGKCVPNVVNTPKLKVNNETVTPRPQGAYQGCKCELTEQGQPDEQEESEKEEPQKNPDVETCKKSGGTEWDSDKNECVCPDTLTQTADKKKCTKPVEKSENNACTESGGIPGDNDSCSCRADKNLIEGTDENNNAICVCVPNTETTIYSFDEDTKACVATAKDTGGSDSENNGGGSGGQSDTPNTGQDPEEAEKNLKAAQEKYDAAKAREQSFANRALGATSSAATGLGAMQLAEGIAEKNADREAEEDMNAYIATMKCTYGKGQQVELGNEDVTLPGGNELVNLYTEYKQTAERLKVTKKALGLRAGIENEVLYDKAQTGLYQYANTGKTGGGYTSLFNALTDETSDDAAAWASQKDISAQKRTAGTTAGSVGAIGGAAGNLLINKDTFFKTINQNQ